MTVFSETMIQFPTLKHFFWSKKWFRQRVMTQIDNKFESTYRVDHMIRARKLYTSARIYEWKLGKGEWKLPFASPT